MILDANKLKRDIEFDIELNGIDFVFHSTWGLFSPTKIDEGTKILINKLDILDTDICLDLGCGYGAIGCYMAKKAKKGKVHMIDKDYIAVNFAKKNAQINNLDNCEVYLSNGFSEVPKQKFDKIASNLPAKVGKEMISIILHDAKERLKKGGCFYVVVISGLKSYIKRNFKEVFGNYKKLKQGKNYAVIMALKE